MMHLLKGTASGGTPGYTFTWSNTFVGTNNINLDAGTYTLTVTDSKVVRMLSKLH
ncbi:MAG: hypothetical protein IPG89_15580 [Bacteroidetes bacterium]|nr:hypothetical protein [Bacteroidota bacterium]